MITLKCRGCQTVGKVAAHTAGLRCTCGSQDFVTPGSEDFLSFMGVAKRAYADPPGWNEYEGPKPGRNPFGNDEPATLTCTVCKGSGQNPQDNRNNGVCRLCKGTGRQERMTDPKGDVLVARHPGQTTIPQVQAAKLAARAEVKAEPVALDAACGLCKRAGVELRPDRAEHAWLFCAACGPLVDLDTRPEFNPYAHPVTAAQRGFKTAGLRKVKATGRVLKMVATVRAANPGLTDREVLGLVRRTVASYPEN